MRMDVEIEEYSPNFLERLFSRGGKWQPSFSGPDKILVSGDLEEDKAKDIIKHEFWHFKTKHALLPYVALMALSLQFFPIYAPPIIVGGLILWEGSAVIVEKTALPTRKMREEIKSLHRE